METHSFPTLKAIFSFLHPSQHPTVSIQLRCPSSHGLHFSGLPKPFISCHICHTLEWFMVYRSGEAGCWSLVVVAHARCSWVESANDDDDDAVGNESLLGQEMPAGLENIYLPAIDLVRGRDTHTPRAIRPTRHMLGARWNRMEFIYVRVSSFLREFFFTALWHFRKLLTMLSFLSASVSGCVWILLPPSCFASLEVFIYHFPS